VERPPEDEPPTFPPAPPAESNNVTVPLPGVSAPNKNTTGAIITAAVVPVVIILALAVAISLLLATFTKWRSKRSEESYELAQGKYIIMNTVIYSLSSDIITRRPSLDIQGFKKILLLCVGAQSY
jgi:hypothetical protein